MFLLKKEGHREKQMQAYVFLMQLLPLDYDCDFCLWSALRNYKLIH